MAPFQPINMTQKKTKLIFLYLRMTYFLVILLPRLHGLKEKLWKFVFFYSDESQWSLPFSKYCASFADQRVDYSARWFISKQSENVGIRNQVWRKHLRASPLSSFSKGVGNPAGVNSQYSRNLRKIETGRYATESWNLKLILLEMSQLNTLAFREIN